MSLKVFHTADWHLGSEMSYLGAKADSRRYEMLATFKNAVDYCKENGVSAFLIAGDLFDSNKAAEDFAPSVFEYIKNAADIKFFYVAGNHDPLDAASAMNGGNIPENLYLFGTDYEIKEFSEEGFRIIGRSFPHSSMEPKPFNTVIPDDGLVNIMLLHADAGADRSSPYNPIDRDFIENSGVDYLALGHIHKRTSPAKFGKTTFTYSGSPEGHGFDEEGIRGGYLAEISKASCNLTFARINRRTHRVLKVDISEASSSIRAADLIIQKLSDDLGEAFTDDLYKIVLTGGVAEDVTLKKVEILQILADRLYFVKVKDKTKKAYDLDTLKNETTLRGVFVKKMCEKIEKAEGTELELLNAALELGLAAFDSEVAYSED